MILGSLDVSPVLTFYTGARVTQRQQPFLEIQFGAVKLGL